MARRGEARHGEAWSGEAWLGTARHSMDDGGNSDCFRRQKG